MKLWLKLLLAALAGFGGGFAAGFYAHKKANDIQFEEVTEEDFNALLEGLPEDVRKISSDTPEAGKKAVFEAKKAIVEAETDTDKIRNALQGKTPYMKADDDKKKEYSKMWETMKSYSNEENADEMPVEVIEDEDPENGMDDDFLKSLEDDIRDEPEIKKEPYMISLGDFYEERREYDKITIDWYDEDDIILDETENPVDDIVGYVGCSMSKLFGEPPMDDDPDVRFVRNDKYGTDYEIIRHHASWKAVSGE